MKMFLVGHQDVLVTCSVFHIGRVLASPFLVLQLLSEPGFSMCSTELKA